ncbi:MAG: arabinan endo-1,5-alpha-L-arabinosidase [Roseburia sp.]|nr:arabinan endo-1,5-alpha-L-arabinosidase [Roseburia sp.]MCM1098523.1 arabinan endo-1,5-alpha-L-arabinosidase [Ruminococcus flavefaciens]
MNFTYPQEPPRPAPKPQRPLFGSKAAPLPPHSVWMIHDPAIYRDPVSNDYLLYCTGGRAFRSSDLIRWTSLGRVVEDPPACAREWTRSKAIWAPDIIKVDNEYRLYCSNSSFGVRQSCIFLAVSDRAEGPFQPKGIVLRSSDRLYVNAIDANIAEDVRTGKQYMAYGSFWGGCHIIELDRKTGYAKNGPDDMGFCLARRPDWADTAIEGPYIIYHPDMDYYYLFVSYASLKSDYNIRVGRSRDITGPYLDHNGRDLRDLSDEDATLGYMLACGYKFDDDPNGYMGPGHNSVLRDKDGEWYLVSHIRPHNLRQEEPSFLQIRKMLWTEDGWPLVSPEPYAGERLQPVAPQLLSGSYERIKLTPQVPQGTLTSVKMTLRPDGTGLLADSVRIRWETTGFCSLKIRYANTTEEFQALAAWDWEAWRPTLVLTGCDQKHICIWGKKFDPPAAPPV